jgi:hypothetical protein
MTEVFRGYEEYYLLGYNAVYSIESEQTFRGNKSPQSSGSKNKPNKYLCLLPAGFFLWLLFDLEDRGDMFSRNIG